ncbi:hypothetical protein NEFER03_1730 [Nematocida sp. LUAm3]|nr:hypothetical protein NEFER03_1730 [Nematocida sp. LUAm3]KAI5175720.1 hypothetical protein NEFER02_1607 [Nematocida sp. LUAm2]KAI5178626.1 hypothetical protein NEFER01_1762 [Nematocida sp. LUAm1]
MIPKSRFILISILALLIVIGILVLLLITSTPRSTDYEVLCIGHPSCTSEEYLDGVSIPVERQVTLTLYDVLYEFGVINTQEDLDSSESDFTVYADLQRYVGDPFAVEMVMMYQVAPAPVVSTREYMAYQKSCSRVLYFTEEDPKEEYTISAYNYNLRTRQTAIFLFFQKNEKVFGYVLNNVWLRPRQHTSIHLLASPKGVPFLISDLDNNMYQLS